MVRQKSAQKSIIHSQKAEESRRVIVENCFHGRPCFTAQAASFNEKAGRLCVLRRLDHNNNNNNGAVNVLSVVEFYNAQKPPLVYLEKSIHVMESLESVIWMDSWAVIGGTGGRLFYFSPFTSKFGRVQICTSEVVSISRLDPNQFALCNGSGELLLLKKQSKTLDAEEKDADALTRQHKTPAFATAQTLRFSSDQHITSLACTCDVKPAMIAVGFVNGLTLLNVEEGGQRSKWTRNEIAVARLGTSPTIIWSMVFMKNFLITGDSNGQLTIYATDDCSLLKTFQTHQAPITAIAAIENEIFAAGTDYRIQIISSAGRGENDRYNWRWSGQRLFHTNDVRFLCVLDKRWLLSGGSEHDLFISQKHFYVNPQLRSECAFSVSKRLLINRHLSHIDIWWQLQDEKARSEPSNTSSIKNIGRIVSGNIGFIKQACISPDGRFIAYVGNVKGAVRVVEHKGEWCSSSKCLPSVNGELFQSHWSNHWDAEDGEGTGGKAVSALHCSNKYLYFARAEFSMFRLDFATKKLQAIAKQENYGHVIRLIVNEAETVLIALTTKDVLRFNLQTIGSDLKWTAKLALPNHSVPFDCCFIDDRRLIFLTTDLSHHLIGWDLEKCVEFLVWPAKKMGLCESEWIAYMGMDGNGQLAGVTNKGRMRFLLFEDKQGCPRLLGPESVGDTKNKSVGHGNKRIEPFWVKSSHVLLVGHVDEITPSQNPAKLKFFGKS